MKQLEQIIKGMNFSVCTIKLKKNMQSRNLFAGLYGWGVPHFTYLVELYFHCQGIMHFVS